MLLTFSHSELEDEAIHVTAFNKMVAGVPAALELIHKFFVGDDWDRLVTLVRPRTSFIVTR
jgi:hypothetical protein